MPRSVDIAPCDHEGRDYHRVLPTRHQRRRARRPTGRRTPHQLRPPSPTSSRPSRPATGGCTKERRPVSGGRAKRRQIRFRSRSCGFPRRRCPATRASGSACPAAGSGPRSSGTRPRWCTWPARYSWARMAPRWPGGSACPRSRCTRPTCRPTRGHTGSAGPARRSPGAAVGPGRVRHRGGPAGRRPGGARGVRRAAGRRTVLSRSWPALTKELIGHYAAVLGARRAKVRI